MTSPEPAFVSAFSSERTHDPERDRQPEALEGFPFRVFRVVGADSHSANEVARHLVRSNLSGHDSHEVICIPEYIRQLDEGELVPAARLEVVRESPVTALIDAYRGFDQYSNAYALEWAMHKARQTGMAATAVRHSTHIGRLEKYTERAGEEGLIAIITVGAGKPGVGGMLLHGGKKGTPLNKSISHEVSSYPFS